METVYAIFTKLGVDSSLLPQFFTIVAMFILAQYLFLGKLQNILEVREEKTVKLENSADDTLEKVKLLQVEHKNKIDQANRDALKVLTDKKHVVTQKYTDQYKQTEKEVNQYIDSSRAEFTKEVEANKGTYLAEANSLAKSLVQKILQ